ncbi:glutathione S-transferase T3-like [Eutrema salsugineum]|uniref:glutathione S-transferase T3-like n=1 Tax=Eutrema salsugineum TaxID=72664 RepID=UPI000CECF4D8|nr:glutathione S-transferase T3-like [Eutrema salsugineum]
MPHYSETSSEGPEIDMGWAYADATYGIPEKCFCGKHMKLETCTGGAMGSAGHFQIPNDGYSHIIDLGSSEVPVFSTQTSDAPSGGVKTPAQRIKWSPKEDIILINLWLNTSKDPVVGNDQKDAAFWKCISYYYNSSPQLAGQPKREIGQCKQRWCRINDQVCKFVGCYEAAMKEKTSGQNENDVMKAAHDIFFNDHSFKFGLEHAWQELRHDQKWCKASSLKDSASSKRQKLDEGGSAQSSNNVEVVGNGDDAAGLRRPPGVKAEKAKAKKLNSGKEEGKALLKFQNLWSIRQQGLEMNAQLAKSKQQDLELKDPLATEGFEECFMWDKEFWGLLSREL